MTTEDMLNQIADNAYRQYKKHSKGCVEALKLDRKEPVEIDGNVFNCWREYVIYKMGEYVLSKIPDANVEVVLDGNDSTLHLSCNDDEIRRLNVIMNNFIKEI